MSNQPLISVIVVVRNGAAYLAQALKSIVDQHHRPLEIIVVDGQSTDRTAEIARSFENVRYLWQDTLGLANARNQGIAAARSEWIAFLDHDDLWAPRKLAAQVEVMLAQPEIEYTITHLQYFLENGHALRPGFDTEGLTQNRIGCTPSALLARRSIFESHGCFDPSLRMGCDADWFARVRDAQIPMAVIAEPLVFKRIHNANTSADVRTNKIELMEVIRRSIQRKG